MGKAFSGIVALLMVGCGGQAQVQSNVTAPRTTQVASSSGSAVFAGCQGSESGNRSTIKCDNFVLLAIRTDKQLSTDRALDQAIANAGVETARGTISLSGNEHDVRTYEMRNAGAKIASVTAMVTAVPRDDELLVLHCGSSAQDPDEAQCKAAYEAYLAQGMPAEVLAAGKHGSGGNVTFVGRNIKLPLGCNAVKADLVKCQHAEILWQIRDSHEELKQAHTEHLALLDKRLADRGGAIKGKRDFNCLVDLSPAQCTETTIDLGMEQFGTLKVYTASGVLRDRGVFAVCSFFPGDGADEERPCTPFLEVF
jgi:hypothetical protein